MILIHTTLQNWKKKKVHHLPPHPRSLILGIYFLIEKNSLIKFQKLSDLEVFNLQKWREKISKNCHIFVFGFLCTTKIIKGLLNFCKAKMVYSHIWLHLPRDDDHFFDIFLWMMLKRCWVNEFLFLHPKFPGSATSTLDG